MDREPTAFHRTMYVFVSPQASAAPLLRVVRRAERRGRATSFTNPAPYELFGVSCPEQTSFTRMNQLARGHAVPRCRVTGSERLRRAAEDDAAALCSVAPAAVTGCASSNQTVTCTLTPCVLTGGMTRSRILNGSSRRMMSQKLATAALLATVWRLSWSTLGRQVASQPPN